MGGIQQCCFEDRKNGLRRLINKKKLINEPLRRKIQKSKKRPEKEVNKNNSDNQLKGKISGENIKLNKETKNKNINNQKIDDLYEISNSYTINKYKKKKKYKSSSLDCSKILKRKNTFDVNEEKPNYNISHKKNFIKGELIGEGRFGKVYSGLCISSGEIFTIKIYDNISDCQKNKIIKNLDILYKLKHKNIIKAFTSNDGDIIDENGQLCILYESIKSKNVGELIKNFGSLNENIIQKYIKQLLEGLKYLHENKIYHKNLKPSNILVDEDGRIKISDCLIDNLLLGDAKDIYSNYIKSDKIDYYIPSFFIHIINEYNDKKAVNKDNELDNIHDNNKDIFNDWISYDLWSLGCLIIEASSSKKPWSHYNFTNNKEFFDFLGSTNLVPTIPQKLSLQCQELIKILLDYNITKKPNIYDIIFNLDFVKINPENFTYNNKNNKFELRSNISDTLGNLGQNEDSNINMSNIIMSESEMQLGQVLADNKVVNILNTNNSASFSISCTVEDNLSYSQSFMNNKINQSILSKGKNKNLNNINIKKTKNIMPEVKEAQIEQSPDPVKDEEKKNFIFSKQ